MDATDLTGFRSIVYSLASPMTSTNTFSRITPTTTTTYRQPSYDPSPSTTIVVRPTDVAAQAAGQSTYDLARESSRSVAAAASSTLSTDGALWTRVSTIASSESDQRPLGTPGAQVSDSKSGGGTDGKLAPILSAVSGLLFITVVVLVILYRRRRRREVAAQTSTFNVGGLRDRRVSGAFTLFPSEDGDDPAIGREMYQDNGAGGVISVVGGVIGEGARRDQRSEKRRRMQEEAEAEDHHQYLDHQDHLTAAAGRRRVDSDAASVISETNILRRKLDGWSAVARSRQAHHPLSNDSPDLSTSNLLPPSTSSHYTHTHSPFSDTHAVPPSSLLHSANNSQSNLSSSHPAITPFRPPTLLPTPLAPLHLPPTSTTSISSIIDSQSPSSRSRSRSVSPEIALSPHFRTSPAERSESSSLARGLSLQARDAGVSLMGHRMDGEQEQEEAPPAYVWG